MEDNNAEVVARSLLDARLDLKYVEVFNSGKAIKIAACAIALTFAILYLSFSSGPFGFAVGACSLLFAIRLLLGAPTEIQLTPESFQRLQSWLVNEDEETDEETSEQ